MTDFETAMLSFLQDAQNEFNSEKEVEHFIGKHAPKLMEAARKQLMAEPISEDITTRLSTDKDAATLATINNQNKTINELQGEVVQAKHAMERMKKESDANYQQTTGCLDAVKAMLELSQGNGATHRMRDFYGESIIKFIDSAKQKLAARHDADPMPF